MQRVVSINLDGNAYQVEENGYNALFAFLDAAETSLQDSPDRAQRLADLERAIAAKCQALLNPHKTVVTSSEVDRLLVELEPARAQPAAEPAAASSQSSSTSSSSSSSSSSSTSSAPASDGSSSSGSHSSGSTASGFGHPHRRLFQIREGAMISGVCVGLSEYMHIDVTIIRILFAVFALASSGWGLLVYGVLMFIVPRVDTRAEASVGTPASAGPYEWPWDKHGWPWDKHGWPWDQPGWDDKAKRDWKEASQQFGEHFRDRGREWRAAGMEHHPWPIFGTLSMIVFLMFGFFWLSFWTRGHFFFGWPFFWGFPHWFGIIFFFMMLRFVFMPFRSRWYGYGAYPYAHPHHAWASMWNGLAWFIVMIFAVWFAYRYIPEVHDLIRGWDNTLTLSTWHV